MDKDFTSEQLHKHPMTLDEIAASERSEQPQEWTVECDGASVLGILKHNGEVVETGLHFSTCERLSKKLNAARATADEAGWQRGIKYVEQLRGYLTAERQKFKKLKASYDEVFDDRQSLMAQLVVEREKLQNAKTWSKALGEQNLEFEIQLAAERKKVKSLVEAMEEALLPIATWKFIDESEPYKEFGPDLRKCFLDAHASIMAALAKVK
jgi:small-conductance mechanosensitive channel